MKKIIGDVICKPGVNYSEVEEITGGLDCHGADTKAAFPRLSTVGGWLDCRGYTGTFDKLTTVGGWLDCRGADTRAAFPKLTQKEIGNSKALDRVKRAFKVKGFLFADGILAKIVSSKRTSSVIVHKIVIVGKTKASYCIESGDSFSHGDTIKEARESLQYKIGSRDKSAFERWTLETKITRRQAIESYRVITGACELGVRHFVEGNAKANKKTYTVKEVIALTKGQYEAETYKAFFKGATK